MTDGKYKLKQASKVQKALFNKLTVVEIMHISYGDFFLNKSRRADIITSFYVEQEFKMLSMIRVNKAGVDPELLQLRYQPNYPGSS